ncbi:antizyme inhibitor 1b [Anguilla anguilla]|uniref:antizyme inhibitor 1b n=1 Tax=Anguilla anguilla TaxID=7936 RepID=UPI0015B310BF|nr:antizyme inhibitor 1b [Anguilla anguilla]XP_035287122.1 antizyme inhibitor 1b [Anguilla anguilla]
MKGLCDEPNYTIDVLEGGVTLGNVIDDHIYEQELAERSAFFVADLGVLTRQHALWQTHVPRVRPFYTLKCNSSPAVVQVLAALGTGFVCANKSEVALVQSFGVDPENVIYAGAYKQLSHIKHAAKAGVHLLACDSEMELRKIARCHPGARLLLQVATAGCQEEMSMSFGCSLKSCRHLLQCAKLLGLQVVGAKFHVPVACSNPLAYCHAVSDARCVFDMGEELGFNMTVLDISIGLNGSEAQLEQVVAAVQPLLDVYFPPLSGVDVVAELGSYYVSSSFTLAVNIIGKEVLHQHPGELSPNSEPEFLYYMNDGVYGSFASKLLEDTIPEPLVHKKSLRSEEAVFPSSLWGPSCDGLDQVVEHCLLPELSTGDWVIFSNMGANSLGEACTAAQRALVYYVISPDDWYEMQEAGISLDTNMKDLLLVPYYH